MAEKPRHLRCKPDRGCRCRTQTSSPGSGLEGREMPRAVLPSSGEPAVVREAGSRFRKAVGDHRAAEALASRVRGRSARRGDVTATPDATSPPGESIALPLHGADFRSGAQERGQWLLVGFKLTATE